MGGVGQVSNKTGPPVFFRCQDLFWAVNRYAERIYGLPSCDCKISGGTVKAELAADEADEAGGADAAAGAAEAEQRQQMEHARVPAGVWTMMSNCGSKFSTG